MLNEEVVMGTLIENRMRAQLVERLDALIVEQRRTNELLGALLQRKDGPHPAGVSGGCGPSVDAQR